MASSTLFRTGRSALVRAVANAGLPIPPCPDLDDPSPPGERARLTWLREVWSDQRVSETLQHASPVLAAQVRRLCSSDSSASRDVRRAVASVVRYILRAEHRATPFGLFAGVSAVSFGPRARARWGPDHAVIGRASAEWLTAVVDRLEAHPDLLGRLLVVVNNAVAVRGDRLVVPYRSAPEGEGRGAVEASIGLTGPVRAVLNATCSAIRIGDLADELDAEFPAAGHDKVLRLVQELVGHQVLITSLRAPSTETDVLRYVLGQLDAVDASSLLSLTDTIRELRYVHEELRNCDTPEGRDRVTARMRALAPDLRRHPLAIDMRLDARVELPEEVAREIESAATVLSRVSAHPYGTASWKTYQRRFYERYGIGTMVPLKDVVADSGTGFPDGYPGTSADGRRSRVSTRDDALVQLAQAAVLDGREEVVLTDELLAAMDLGPEHPRVPPHLEIGVRVYANSSEELERGRFRLEIVSVSRGIGVTTGRFLSVLSPEDRERLTAELADLPACDAGTVPAQLSFPPLRATSAHVTRAPQVLPTVISVQEHRAGGGDVLTPDDLAVACDGRRMYLAAPERGQRVEAVGMHALNLKEHTPPLVRFVTELSRAQCAQVTLFDWGAAGAMPFLPRLRYGRTVLSPARWRLEASELPAADRPRSAWETALKEWRGRRRMPHRVCLAEGDRRLLLDLDEAAHRALLRQHLDRSRLALLVEAPGPEAYGWCAGRSHEVVVPVKATRPPAWPALPAPTPARRFSPAQIQPPGISSLLLATLYGDLRRQDTVLGRHLPDLLKRLGGPPWWFIRFRDPHQHLRLRIALPAPDAFAATAREVSTWADELRTAGLLSDLRFPTSYREMGRWGSGVAWDAAEEVFRADSRAVLAQLSQPQHPHQRALVAAHTVAIATTFLGSTEAGIRWLVDHIPPAAPAQVARPQFAEAVRLADPSNDFAALRSVFGGQAIVDAWADREAALAAYRLHIPGPDTVGVALDDVLSSLLHVHFVRHVAVDFPEEEICLYLTRAAALAWISRRTR
ncbi:lantibiotic dehydratase [Streptomyces acidiscabies]|uniref:Lantibiotic dehydratase n=1 Tax=Streptomyces acidiscabies TaxID=42234 RepID=A0AAP6EIY8_9ACTN|nr:lantibiotic dehydratase [Streptomyces acidiscabies]MBZ3916797.1 lantibiotic dehydratase [Streptomyces acidiscabies]MDX2964398.1 lantibiotic dehydratase [Streptomyces acidiscabies]MDX3022947.1 lantibiotic dehydratase [Streptomyces acidiscabies]MDX3794221.1 lantibiotic dehydratase [Streptomyces acidiscabies]